MTNKMTYSIALDNAINGTLDNETIEKLKDLKIQIDKKNKSGSSKPTKRQTENETVVKPAILSVLDGVDSMTATEIAKATETSTGLEVSTSRASQLLKQLVEDGKVVKTIEKRVSKFSLA